MQKILSIGTATIDIVAIIPDKDVEQISFSNNLSSFLMLETGSKLELSSNSIYFGGGAVNAAISMRKLGATVDCLIKVGSDKYGNEIKQYLQTHEIGTKNVITSSTDMTAMSVIISSHDGNPAVLTHRGANSNIDYSEINIDTIKEYDAIYITNLSGKSADIFNTLIDTAYNNNVKIISNPGIKQITNATQTFLDYISKINVFVVNRKEAEELLKLLIVEGVIHPNTQAVPNEDKGDVLKNGRTIVSIEHFLQTLTNLGSEVAVITDGKNGSYIYNDNNFYHILAPKVKPVATVGAGDSFVSTLTFFYLNNTPIELAATYATNNAMSVVQSIDAHSGLRSYSELTQE